MIKLAFDAIKENHSVYNYIKQIPSFNYQFAEPADITIIALEDTNKEATGRHRSKIAGYKNKSFFLYFEHPSFFTELGYEFTKEMEKWHSFHGSISHSLETIETLRNYQPDGKYFYLPVGVPKRDWQVIKSRLEDKNRVVCFLFWGSWNDINNGNFYGRGGLYADEIFCQVRKEVKCKFIVKSPIRLKSEELFPESVKRITGYLSQEELNKIYSSCDVYLLPAIQAHFATIPEAMSFGLPCVGNNGWG